jgi:dTDP-4-amino-4,6-dideoxygalactose transaminase
VTRPIRLVDLRVTPGHIGEELDAVRRVLERGWFVLGPEVTAFEAALARSTGVAHAVGVGSGTDALILGLRALGIGPGDDVIVPSFTAFPTAAAVLEVGARPLLVDVEADRPLLDLNAAAAARSARTKAVILVHLYGVTADTQAFVDVFGRAGIHVVEDVAQAHGARLADGRPAGSVGVFGALSFYPTKNLGAAGDAGAVVTSDDALAAGVSAWRSHGEVRERYVHELPARNSRLDDLQAALLHLRLADFDHAIARRRELSGMYERGLPAGLRYTDHGAGGAPHLAVVRSAHRESLADALAAVDIQTGRHYPRPLHEQPALKDVALATPAPNATGWAAECLSLPLHLGLSDFDVARVIRAVCEWSTEHTT